MNKNHGQAISQLSWSDACVFHSVIGYHWIIDNWCNSRVIADCGCGLCAGVHLKPERDEGAGADRERVYSAMQCPIKYWDRGANQNTLLTFDPGEQYIGVLKRKGKFFLYKNYNVPLFWSNNHGFGCLSGHCCIQKFLICL